MKMKHKTTLLKLFALVVCMMCWLSAVAAEAYVVYTASNKTLTFYYDNQRSSRSGTKYDLNTGLNRPGWVSDDTHEYVTKVVFDPSFANARPTSTFMWFTAMPKLQGFTGLGYLNTSQVTNMAAMFSLCPLESLDLSSFNTSKVTDMRGMFLACPNLQTIYVGSGWNTNAVSQSSQMFEDCYNLEGGKGTTYDENHVDKAYAHVDGGPSNPGYLTDKSGPEAYACYTSSNTTMTFYYDNQRNIRTGTTYDLNTEGDRPQWFYEWYNAYDNPVSKVVFHSSFANARPTTTFCWFATMTNLQSITGLEYLNTSQVTDMHSMFDNCWELTSLNLSSFNTAKVTDMNNMFFGCEALTSLNLSSFNTAKVTDMNYMFCGCRGLTSLDLSNFNTSKVTDMRSMFYSCSNLQTIYAGSGWSTAAVSSSDSQYMFNYCTKIRGSKGTTYDANHVDKAYARLDGGPSNPGYLSEHAIEAYAVYTPSNTTMTFYYDNLRSTRSGRSYSLRDDEDDTEWFEDETCYDVTRVVFDPSFANARPVSTANWFGEMFELQSISGMNYLNTSQVTTMYCMFGNCSKLTSIDLSHFNTAKVTNMMYLFSGCSSLTSLNLSTFNTANVTNMLSMFSACSGLTSLNVSNFNTAKVTNMQGMFRGCTKLTSLDLSNFNTAKVTDMSYMFASSGFTTLDLTNFSTANVTNMLNMFYECTGLTNVKISSFNTAKVTNMRYMFHGCTGLTSLDLSSFNTSKVTDMSYMFIGSNNLTTIYAGSGWSTAAVTISTDMFKNCTKIRGSKGTTYNASHVDKAYAHIDGGTSNPGYLSSSEPEAYAVYTSSNKTLTFYFDDMRNSRSGTTYDLSTGSNNPGWVTDNTNSAVTRVVFNSTFAGARPTTTYKWFILMSNLQSITGMTYLNTSSVTNMALMFYGCNRLTSLDLSNFNTAKVTDMSSMFQSCVGLESLDLSSFNTAKVTNMSFMFFNCTGLESLNLSSFNTANVTNMSGMFMGCIGLTNIDVNNLNTAKVTDMSAMFANCYGLKRLNLKSFNTAKVTDMSSMFSYNRDLVTIYVGEAWNTSAVTSSDGMFRECTSIKGGKGTTYDANHLDKTYARIDGGRSKPGYLSRFLLGDVNNDGEVNIADVNFLINMILSDDTDIVGDVNGDREVNIADINFLIDIILNS